MGSWSVYCGISQIAITYGNDCVLLPLKKNNANYGYDPNLPATLPIFGKYDDYGGLVDIEKDENTKAIEEHFGISIEDFVVFFVDGKHTYGRKEYVEIMKKMKNYDEASEWNFMFIDRKVYDFMSTHNSEDSAGHLDFGNPSLLKLLGFKHEGKSNDKRYTELYSLGDFKVMSDGRFLHLENGGSIFYFKDKNGGNYSLVNHIDLPEDKMWIGEKTMAQLWEHLDDSTCKDKLLPLMGSNVYTRNIAQYERLLNKLEGKEHVVPEPTTLLGIYERDFRTHGKLLCDLVTIRRNMHPMSMYFKENTIHITPQCGEYIQHQEILNKFSEINKSYIE